MTTIRHRQSPRRLANGAVLSSWSGYEDAVLVAWYLDHSHRPLERQELARLLHRTSAAVARRANELGVCDPKRHTVPEERGQLIRATSLVNGTVKLPTHGRGRGGRRPDIDNRYFRSSWEANWARYLRWLQSNGSIRGWEYEPETYVFHGVTRGPLTYTPDFRITEIDGTTVFHEVKGWMDPKSKGKLRRMAKFYPQVSIQLIQKPEYDAARIFSALIDGWE